MNRDAETRARIEDHWAASEAGTHVPSMRSTPPTRSWTTRNPASAGADRPGALPAGVVDV